MKYTIEEEDIYWEMDWSTRNTDGERRFPNMPEKEMIFEENFALAHLLINKVLCMNSNWWEEDWPEDARKSTYIGVNCSDTFAWACADAERMEHSELRDVYDHWKKDPMFGPTIWCIKKRKQKPLKQIYDRIEESGIWDMSELIF